MEIVEKDILSIGIKKEIRDAIIPGEIEIILRKKKLKFKLISINELFIV